jgi:hypothetical protein
VVNPAGVRRRRHAAEASDRAELGHRSEGFGTQQLAPTDAVGAKVERNVSSLGHAPAGYNGAGAALVDPLALVINRVVVIQSAWVELPKLLGSVGFR